MKFGSNSFVLHCFLLVQREAVLLAGGRWEKEGKKKKKKREGEEGKKKAAVFGFPLYPENPHLQPAVSILDTRKRSGD